MIVVKYDSNRKYDFLLEKIIDDIKKALYEKEDDFLLLCCGTTGTGKSRLLLHIIDKYLGEKADVKYIGLNRTDFSNALLYSNQSDLPRFCANDEANISKRDANTKFNKAVLDLYFSIRGKQIFHWWSNPSLDIIDKPFIEERIKGVILITTKDIKRPRIYYYFRKVDILKIWEKYGNLKLNLLKRVCKEYAFYRGWFKDYDGKLLNDYKTKKEVRMDDKIDEFHQNWGSNDRLTSTKIRQVLGISASTFDRIEAELKENGSLKQEDIQYSITNRKQYPKSAIQKFEELIKSKHETKVCQRK